MTPPPEPSTKCERPTVERSGLNSSADDRDHKRKYERQHLADSIGERRGNEGADDLAGWHRGVDVSVL